MNPIIEAIAKALVDADDSTEWYGDDFDRFFPEDWKAPYVKMALAAYEAMVGALTDEQCEALIDRLAWPYSRKHTNTTPTTVRAALIDAAKEVDGATMTDLNRVEEMHDNSVCGPESAKFDELCNIARNALKEVERLRNTMLGLDEARVYRHRIVELEGDVSTLREALKPFDDLYREIISNPAHANETHIPCSMKKAGLEAVHAALNSKLRTR